MAAADCRPTGYAVINQYVLAIGTRAANPQQQQCAADGWDRWINGQTNGWMYGRLTDA